MREPMKLRPPRLKSRNKVRALDNNIEATKKRLRNLGCTEAQVTNHLRPTKASVPDQEVGWGSPRVPHYTRQYRFY
jgi:hypothetical protein